MSSDPRPGDTVELTVRGTYSTDMLGREFVQGNGLSIVVNRQSSSDMRVVKRACPKKVGDTIETMDGAERCAVGTVLVSATGVALAKTKPGQWVKPGSAGVWYNDDIPWLAQPLRVVYVPDVK